MISRNIPRDAALLGYAGAIPFAACAALTAWGDPALRQSALAGFLIYGAVILSFLGGMRWGAAAAGGGDSGRALMISVVPSLWAAFMLWWPSDAAAAWGLMTGFILMGMLDWLRPGVNVPEWMRPLRLRLTAAVVVCHLVVIGVIGS